jgi:short-subunit dehydrogenase
VASRVAVITGASSGIGAALARRLARAGALCVLLARREERLAELAAEVGGEYEVCDVADRAAVDAVGERVRARHGAIDLLVNNAGIPSRGSFLDSDPERIEEVMRVNYFGSVWCLRAFMPALLAAGRADVVNIVSVAGTVASGPGGPYAASKHAQIAFSRAITGDLARRGVRVHTVNPGFVETEGFPQRATLTSSLMRRAVVDPEVVADHVLAVLARRRTETFVPAWYRAAAVAQALAPGLVARAAARPVYRRARGRPDGEAV